MVATAAAQSMRSLRQHRVGRGLCRYCGLRPIQGTGELCSTCSPVQNSRVKRYRARIRAQVLQAYGSCCACCGETIDAFLTLDHIDGGGSEESTGGYAYRRAIREGFPDSFQLLCFNCNIGREKNENRLCPHVTKSS